MPSERIETIFQRDLDRLPALAEDEWVPRGKRASSHIGLASVFAVFLAVVAVVGVGLTVDAVREVQLAEQPRAATAGADYILVPESAGPFESTTSSVAAGAVSGFPTCPAGQLPWISTPRPTPPGDVPGTGSASAELAFRRANPAITQFTMYRWNDNRPASPDDPGLRAASGIGWIVADNQTFIVVAPSFGKPGETNNWFAYPAKFMGCRTPANPRAAPP
jgi:hypothetical protein